MANIQEQITRARAAGYDDEAIAQHLSATVDFADKIKTAKTAGYKASEIVAHLSGDAISERSILSDVGQGVGNAAKGALVGLSDIGDTVIDAGVGLIGNAAPKVTQWNRARNAEMEYITEKQRDSTAFSVGRIGGNIAATLPVGGALGAGVKAVTQAPRASALANALTSGGFRTGTKLAADATRGAKATDMLTRVAGGAITGGASMALVNPHHAGIGAAIGGALPPVLKGAGAITRLAGKGIHALRTPQSAGMAKTVLEAAEAGSPQEIDAIRSALTQQGPSMIPGSSPTVPQILQRPGVSQLQRTVENAGSTALSSREAANNAAQVAALNRISPVAGTVQQAAENMGNTTQRFARSAEADESKRISQLYDDVDPLDESRFYLPIDQMTAAKDKFLGRGTFGSGGAANEAIRTAQNIGTEMAQGAPPEAGAFAKTVPFSELQNLRSSIGEAATRSAEKGNNREAAALGKMLADIDSGVNKVGGGHGAAEESFPLDMAGRWRDANAGHADKMNRFHTGPQASMFRNGSDGQASAQGAELAGKFFNSSRSQVEDAQSFKRLAGDNASLVDALKNYGITDLASQTNKFDRFSNLKFNGWLDGRSGAVREVFDPAERSLLRQVGDEVKAADLGATLGMAKGSNTVQNAQNALSLGLLDSPMVGAMANKIPGVRAFAGPLLASMRESGKSSKAKELGALLADPQLLDSAIGRYLKSQQPSNIGTRFSDLLDAGAPAVYRGAPLLSTSR